ncbi:MAG: NAD(P)H-dependent oxidoreductase [Bauldia sp.]
MSDLVVFYSLSGKSRLVAEWLAKALGADTAEIVEARPRDFEARGVFRCLFDSFLKRRPAIAPMARKAQAYDRVILVCPVWAARIAGPARTWLHGEGKNAKVLGLVLQSGAGKAYPHVLAEIEAAVGRKPDSLLTLSEADHGDKIAEGKVSAFAKTVVPKAAKFAKN